MSPTPRIGVLALQGDVAEHAAALVRVGADALAVRREADLESVAGLVIPGGESTTISLLPLTYMAARMCIDSLVSDRPVACNLASHC